MSDDPRRGLGELGERIAREHLATRGYELVDRNFRTRYGEIDVVAASGGCLVFCEVKTRVGRGPAGPFGPLAAIGSRKRRQVRAIARQWLAERGSERGPPTSEMRFDALGVTLAPDGRLVSLEHVEDAF